MPKISFAMAVYNGENYIEKQIDSIIKQMMDQDELIISYDKSDDRTLEIIKRYELNYKQIRVIENRIKGVANNFNNAFYHSKGDYVFISDQDDIWDENKRVILCETFEKTGADLIIHNGVNINTEDEIISNSFFDMYKISDNFFSYFIVPRYSGCCMAFSKRIKEYIMPIPSNINAYDYWVGAICKMKGKVIFIPDILVYHRMHDNNVTPLKPSKLSVKIGNRIAIFSGLLKRIKANA